jgi:hypothetical protein
MDDADSNLSSSAPAAQKEHNFRLRKVFARHWRENVHYFGLPRHLRNLASSVWMAMLELLPSRRKARFGDLDYDWEHSVNTTRSNVGFRTQLLTGLTGRPYFATEPWLFEQIMQALALSIQQSAVSQRATFSALRNFTFIDLGCGKGRALLMASDYPFQKIVGVEFMPELCRAAQKNIAGYTSDCQQCRHMEVLCMDARDFEFPSRPLVVYLFNPFSEPTFAAVLEKLRKSVERAPRPVYIAYRFTEFEKLLAQAAWLEKIESADQWAVYKNRRDRT